MKNLIFIFKDHFNFSKKSFLIPFAIFLGLNISLYYYFESEILRSLAAMSSYGKVIAFICLYGYGYYLTSLWYGYVYKNPKTLSWNFLIPSFLILLILALERSISIHVYLAEVFSSYPFVHYTRRVLGLMTLPTLSAFVCFILVGTMHFNLKATGITSKNVHIKPFLYILSGIFPLVVLASFNPEFQDYYPLYKTTLASAVSNVPEYMFVTVFELIYGMNLFSVEVIFRGILVIGFVRLLGKGSIFPMVTIYCFIHFGKPVLECVSSIFGGYLLGVIALYTRSIIGGSILHIGMAWQMEFLAWLQHTND